MRINFRGLRMFVCGVAAPRAIGAPEAVSEKDKSVGASDKSDGSDKLDGSDRLDRSDEERERAEALAKFEVGRELAMGDWPAPDGSASRPYPVDLVAERIARMQERNIRRDGRLYNLAWYAANASPLRRV